MQRDNSLDYTSSRSSLRAGTTYANLHKFASTTHEFAVYIAFNAGCLINYGERYRAGERISSYLGNYMLDNGERLYNWS